MSDIKKSVSNVFQSLICVKSVSIVRARFYKIFTRSDLVATYLRAEHIYNIAHLDGICSCPKKEEKLTIVLPWHRMGLQLVMWPDGILPTYLPTYLPIYLPTYLPN